MCGWFLVAIHESTVWEFLSRVLVWRWVRFRLLGGLEVASVGVNVGRGFWDVAGVVLVRGFRFGLRVGG